MGAPRFRLSGTIETERLILRAFAARDLDGVYAMQSRPDVARWLYWEARTNDEVRSALASKVAATVIRAEGDPLCLAAEAKETGELVGDMVLQWTSEAHRQGEIGFIVHPDHQGRGWPRKRDGLCFASRSRSLRSTG